MLLGSKHKHLNSSSLNFIFIPYKDPIIFVHTSNFLLECLARPHYIPLRPLHTDKTMPKTRVLVKEKRMSKNRQKG